MNRLPPQLQALKTAWLATGTIPAIAATPDEIEAFTRGILRKRQFVEMHLALLRAIDWNVVDDVGRKIAGGPDAVRLNVALSEATLITITPGL
jgi:hypothetical protein